ncbi:MAG: RNA 2',3'-cyclic phosphodiesterase [Candidatus Omnitrophica bacterium]|nr:RNA 2',3'-cyclic phosphodiesterase [Candidatus Omnitrophota bacterium]MDD5513329.1 RNA 2',3'-cyclic phosphodiesterase [Candidatus Omnitrophota bacterium]
MRAFIAIELPENTKNLLSRLQQELKNSNADVKWVNPENIHLTLKFIGEIDENQRGQINTRLQSIAASHKSYWAKISSLGAFPKISSPRVIWAGLAEGDLQTKELAAAIEESLIQIGIAKEERNFSSHITLGRSRSGLNSYRLAEKITEQSGKLENPGLEFPVERITLFKSRLSPGGPLYEKLQEVSLKTA